MKRESLDLSEERKILINMIMNTDFLKEIMPMFKPHFMKSPYAAAVSKWVAEYFAAYKEAPQRNIQDIYAQKAKNLQDEEETEMISEFLHRLSKEADDYSLQNMQFSISTATRFLKTQSIERLKEELEEALLDNDPMKAEACVANYTRVEPLRGEGISLFHDHAAVMKAFMREEEVLFTLPGDLGKVAGEFSRGGFIAWLGFMKRGKTWWLWFCAHQAAFAGQKVLFLSLEMQDFEIIRRGWEGLTGSPKTAKEITIPYFEPVGTRWDIAYKTEKREAVDIAGIAAKQKKIRNIVRNGDIKIQAFATHSTTVEDIIAYMDNLQYYDNYVPDVVVIDYADILKPSGGGKETRHQLNDIWMKLRGLAQSRNIAVITASQSNKKGATGDIDVEDSAEDVRKLGHVTKMLIINRNKEEKKKGIFRIASGLERNEGQEFQQAIVLECLDIGKPYLDSRLFNSVIRHDN